MISEAFHAHWKAKRDTKRNDAKKEGKTSSTSAEASGWGGVTSVHGNDFFKTQK